MTNVPHSFPFFALEELAFVFILNFTVPNLYKWGKNKYRTDPTKYINANGEFAIHTRLYITVGKNYIVVRADKKSVRKSDPVFDNKKYKLVKR